MNHSKVLAALVLVLAVSGCRRDDAASSTTTTSAVTPVDTTSTVATPAPQTPAPPAPPPPVDARSTGTGLYHPAGESFASEWANSRATTTPAPAPAAATDVTAPPGVSRDAQAPVAPRSVAPPAVAPRADDPTTAAPSTRENPASMYGYDRATGGAMRPGAASNPNTTSGADPRR